MKKPIYLSNGLRVVYLTTKNDPISACHLFIPTGTSGEAAGQEGVTTLLWSLLLKGTKTKSAREIAEDIESLGASIGAGATHDYTEISCHAISEYFIDTMRIMSETLLNPLYREEEVEKEKSALIAAIRSKKENIFTVANEQMNHRLYGTHPYARPSSGTESTVATLVEKDVMNWHDKIVSPRDAVLAIASPFKIEMILPQIENLLGKSAWPRKPETSPILLAKAPVLQHPFSERRIEKFEQAFLLIGFQAPPIESKDYIPLKILNTLLGGGMSARLFQTLREKEGLAYDVGSFYASKIAGSAFVVYMGLQASRLEEAKKRILDLLKQVQTKKIPKTELLHTKNYFKGSYILDHQTNSQRAHYLGWWEILGKGAGYDKTYIYKIDKVTTEDVSRAAKRLLAQHTVTIEIYPQKSAPVKKVIANVG